MNKQPELQYYNLNLKQYSRREIIAILQDSAEANEVRWRLELAQMQLDNAVLSKFSPVGLANLQRDINAFGRQLAEMRGQLTDST